MAKQAETTILSIYLEEHFDLKELFKMGFFKVGPTVPKSRKDWPAIAERIRFFFGLKTIYHYHLLAPFGPGVPGAEDEKQVTDIVECKDWLMQENRFVNLIANN